MTIAGGIMGALFHRERTGEATDGRRVAPRRRPVGDGPGHGALPRCWACRGRPRPADQIGSQPAHRATTTPRTAASSAFTCLQAGRYWPSLCDAIGRPDLATDPRFADHASILANTQRRHRGCSPRRSPAAPLDEWRARLADFDGQWAVVQDTLEAAVDPQTVANGYLQDCRHRRRCARSSSSRRRCSTTSEPAAPGRAPEFNEHGDAILAELGLDWDTIVDLKVRGVVA